MSEIKKLKRLQAGCLRLFHKHGYHISDILRGLANINTDKLQEPGTVKTYRAWINTPSRLDPLTYLHGTKCIVQDDGQPGAVTVWFTEGDVHSMILPRRAIVKIKLSAAED